MLTEIYNKKDINNVVAIRLLMCLFITMISFAVQAQSMKDMIKKAPAEITPLLTNDNKLDFIDFLDSNMKAEARNVFGEISEMTIITKDYTCINMSNSSKTEMKLLPFGSDTIVCVVNTFMSDSIADSEIAFYSSSWKELPSEMFVSFPSIDDFILPDSTVASADSNIREKIDADIISASLNSSNNDIAFTLTTPNYMNEDDRKIVCPYLRKSIVKSWNGKHFE